MEPASQHPAATATAAGDTSASADGRASSRAAGVDQWRQEAAGLRTRRETPLAASQREPGESGESGDAISSASFWSVRGNKVKSASVKPCELAKAPADEEAEEGGDQYDDELGGIGSLEARRQEKKNKSKKQKRKQRQKRSASFEFELARIKMHERLLVSGQQKLISQLHGGAAYGRAEQADTASIQMPLAGPQNAAIECRHLGYLAGFGRFKKAILHDISLTVPEGSIYGLLGPSGCGKTTMLRCVAGRLEPQRGSFIRVFGYQPNEPGSQIPGPAIGYMPQEVSVYEEFSIHETLVYFGRINRMRAGLLEARIDFLLKFLDLPHKRRIIGSLSGGQQRRVSLAVALIHSPPLLILDEPTVGVDPLLRQIIWNYLVTLATTDKITIVITTHYIEEARQANIVGLMREGRLLAENEPNKLMRQFGMDTLEDVFLKLCLVLDQHQHQQQQQRQQQQQLEQQHELQLQQIEPADDKGEYQLNKSSMDSATSDLVSRCSMRAEDEDLASLKSAGCLQSAIEYRPMVRGQKYASKRLHPTLWLAVLLAVAWKNYLRLRRNRPVLVFQFILPAIQVVLFCLCIGGPPRDIPLAVVNEEREPRASRLFLASISDATFKQVPFGNLAAAIESVRQGHNWAAVHIPARYTQCLNERLLHPADVSNTTLANGTISIYPDLTNLHLAMAIEGAFKEAFLEFSRNTLNILGYDPQLADLPIKLGQPVYGALDSSAGGYLEFMAPGVVISITYVMATGLTALAFILEKRDGLLERSQMAGVGTGQILLAHAGLQVLVMVFQIGLVLAVTFYVFEIPSKGPFLWVVLLILLQGCTGMAFGLLISAICQEENAAIMMLVGTFYVNLILAGIMWPIEAMPSWLRLISYSQPQTIPTISLRSIMARGWSIEEPDVQLGFLITIGWLLVFLLLAGLCMRYIK